MWAKAMDEEIASIEKNQTWELVDLPNGRDVTGLKWIYKTKYNEDGSIKSIRHVWSQKAIRNSLE